MENLDKAKDIKKQEWGYEIVWANQDAYCSKILVFNNQNAKTPFYFQQHTHKTWFVNHGEFRVRYIDTNDGQIYEQELKEGAVFEVKKLMPCSLQLLSKNGSITQASTKNLEDDNYIAISNKNF